MEEMRIPLIGVKFPELEVKMTHWLKKLPQDFNGKWFISCGHPADFANEFKKLNL